MDAAAAAVEFERYPNRPPLCNQSSSTMAPGYEAILKENAHSHSNAVIYVAVVLLFYLLAVLIVTIQHIRSDRSNIRLGSHLSLFFTRRERASSKRRPPAPPPSDREVSEEITFTAKKVPNSPCKTLGDECMV